MERWFLHVFWGWNAQKLKTYFPGSPAMQVLNASYSIFSGSGRWKGDRGHYLLQQPFLPEGMAMEASSVHRCMLRRGRQQSSDHWGGEVTVFWGQQFLKRPPVCPPPEAAALGGSILHCTSEAISWSPDFSLFLPLNSIPYNKSLPKENSSFVLYNQTFTDNGQQASNAKGLGISLRRSLTICGFPDGSVVKNLPAEQEMWVQSLSQEELQMRAWQPVLVFFPVFSS